MAEEKSKVSTVEQKRTLGELLERVAHHQLSAKDALSEIEQWTDYPWKERELSDAFHLLCHFDADADIREKYPDYSATQTDQLLKRAKRLKAGV